MLPPLSTQKGPQDAENPPKAPVLLLLCDLQERQPLLVGDVFLSCRERGVCGPPAHQIPTRRASWGLAVL